MKIDLEKLKLAEDLAITEFTPGYEDGLWEHRTNDALTLAREADGAYSIQCTILDRPATHWHPDEYTDDIIFEGSLAELKKFIAENDLDLDTDY